MPLSPEPSLPMPETEGIFLCWEGDNHFSGFVFALPHQTLSFLRHEITAYAILGPNTLFSFIFQDAPLSELQEDSIFNTIIYFFNVNFFYLIGYFFFLMMEGILLMNCVIIIRGRPAMITRRV